ncbi:hypothetical protein GCM10011390_14990 [Aureimonas endophytica]|uniref:DUF4345 domain-containing protein n=1 Tax=Aureimonas endophytica TaxID=2027858 RepID=A0A916ZHX6_9HYPH|nr:DUF4345 domain-containing protein [Aureimonas endophytica]GGD97232.1 hypothetical protein GCM10011390_14990 [Aureimonas endophytica]
MLELALPETNAELLPFVAGAVTALIGVFALFLPRTFLRALRLQAAPLHPEGAGEARSIIGGFYIGNGLMTMLLFDQPYVQLMLGGAWALAAFGRLVAMLSDKGGTILNALLLLLQLALAAMPLAAAFNLIPN